MWDDPVDDISAEQERQKRMMSLVGWLTKFVGLLFVVALLIAIAGM